MLTTLTTLWTETTFEKKPFVYRFDTRQTDRLIIRRTCQGVRGSFYRPLTLFCTEVVY